MDECGIPRRRFHLTGGWYIAVFDLSGNAPLGPHYITIVSFCELFNPAFKR
jgi:hypothetical protein